MKKSLLILSFFGLVFFIWKITHANQTNTNANIAANDSVRIDSSQQNKPEKLRKDTVFSFAFNDLSKVYNYKIIDKYSDTISREVQIFDKKNTIIATIYPKILSNSWYVPWYYSDIEAHKPIENAVSRSFITGKNLNAEKVDDYMGEIVVADLNFDGLEDFATPISTGADNGPHYAFYIQNKSRQFIYNDFLAENVVWFPDEINNTAKTFTTIVNAGAYAVSHTTYQYNSKTQTWKQIKKNI